ncbi:MULTISPECIES: SAM-dependent methyltransferase [Streptomyces]|uniref:SAM-dependent methyltransferase n=1 Tax=Streptomyces TaxID=1883 RepID=UPI00163B6B75|nr:MULTISPECIES: SAM-dependent methyltransferase [Streptomyces]MBC2876989.1 SAM-dependent methyltransferase [Streptomyces sp. TYQ1024]UBI36014.1 SAM-dependent methyltransferase [Streptomyces mobaraensis]UKW28607.1 SAM-dependent methyltransferase [Streptomyces sp. TYQ1024]
MHDSTADRPDVPVDGADAPSDRLDPVAATARMTAALRARESERPDRLFDDPFAAVLAGETGRRLADRAGVVEAISVRTRYFDDHLLTVTGGAAAAPGVPGAPAPSGTPAPSGAPSTPGTPGAPRQLVLLAAGMDSRAYRLPLPTTVLYEVDRPDLLRLKESLLGDAAPRCARRVPVGADLAADWAGPLTAAGFRPGEPACWLVEGLTQYLEEGDVLRLLDRITELSAPGSHLLTDFVAGSLFHDPAVRPMLSFLERSGAGWRYGTDEAAPLFTERGWRPETATYAAVGKALGRWPEAGPRGGELVHAVR